MWRDITTSLVAAGAGLVGLLGLALVSGALVAKDAATTVPKLPKPAKVTEMKVAEIVGVRPDLKLLSNAETVTNNLMVLSAEELIVTVPASAQNTNRGSVKLAWDAASDPNVTGYALYFRITNTATYLRADVGAVTTARLTGLAEGATYYIYAVSYNAFGTESVPSNPVYYTVPTLIYLRQSGWVVESYGVAGKTNQLLTSTNLVSWQVLTQWVALPDQMKSVAVPNRAQSYFKVKPLP